MNYLNCRGIQTIKLMRYPSKVLLTQELTLDILAGFPEAPCCDVERPRRRQWLRHECEHHGIIYLFWLEV